MNSLRSAVRPIITVVLVFTFCYLAITGKIEPNILSTVVISAISYWFGERKNTNGGNEDAKR